MILMIDNYDSFTYNLVHALCAMGAEVCVRRNDSLTTAEALAMRPRALVISPGPCTPDKAGISVDLIRRMPESVPVLGVCLGHQAVGAAYGARIGRAAAVMHGKTSRVQHDGKGLYAGLKNPFVAGRYHSLAVLREGLPEDLTVTAESEDGEIMGLRHRRLPVYGVQFHPESILTPSGKRLLRNFVNICAEANRDQQTGDR